VRFEVIGLLVRRPDLARVFLNYNNFLQQRGELPTRLRELAILRVAHRHRSAYEWGQHVRLAAETGISEMTSPNPRMATRAWRMPTF
jgi:alkylhydroperoxidase family enzyme